MTLAAFLPRLALIVTLTAAPAAFAHEAAKGPHGGLRVDAGKLHAELVANGSTEVAVYLSDAAQQPLAAAGYTANAILLVEGKPLRFALTPADDKKLVGTSPSPVPAGVKGAVQLTAPDGSTAQAKF